MAQSVVTKLPDHIGIIMDGNGRWAKKRGLPRPLGHIAGAKTLRRVVEYMYDIGIKTITFYAFSTENWNRPDEEVNAIMKLLGEYIVKFYHDTEALHKYATMHIIGDLSHLSPRLKKLAEDVERDSAGRDVNLNIAFNYGGRAEICRAMNLLKNKEGEITQEDISGALYTAGQPDVDLIIRTGGEKRLSNFFLWQSAYAELYFSDKLWPDFTEDDIDDAIRFFAARERRFGGLGK